MYADDTTIYFNLENFDHENVNNEINSEPENITKWLQIIKLSLNTQQIKLMDIHRKQKHIKELINYCYQRHKNRSSRIIQLARY